MTLVVMLVSIVCGAVLQSYVPPLHWLGHSQAPILLGDNARPLLAGLGIEAMAQRRQLRLVDTRQLGDDLRLLLRQHLTV